MTALAGVSELVQAKDMHRHRLCDISALRCTQPVTARFAHVPNLLVISS